MVFAFNRALGTVAKNAREVRPPLENRRSVVRQLNQLAPTCYGHLRGTIIYSRPAKQRYGVITNYTTMFALCFHRAAELGYKLRARILARARAHRDNN